MPRASAFEAKEIAPHHSKYSACFDESDAYTLLRQVGLTNCFVHVIERDSSGAKVLVQFENFDKHTTVGNRGALCVTDGGLKVLDLPKASVRVGFSDNLELAYSLENDWYVFPNGDRLPWRGTNRQSRLWVCASPGSQILALSRSDEKEQVVVRADRPTDPLFTVNINDLGVSSVFTKKGAILLLGQAPMGKDNKRWECWTFRDTRDGWRRERSVVIPGAADVLDLDPESSEVFCCRYGLWGKTAFLFNLDTGAVRKAHVRVWREHGYFLQEGLSRKIRSLLEGR
jgi:hypothetical protein